MRSCIAECRWVGTLLQVNFPSCVRLVFLHLLLKLSHLLGCLVTSASLMAKLVFLIGKLTYSNSIVSAQTGWLTLLILRKNRSSWSGLLAGDGFGSLRHLSGGLAGVLEKMRSC